MPFWKRESLHERLAREGGLVDEPPPHDTRPRWGETGIHGVARPRQWDAVVAVEAPELAGDEAQFVVLPDETLLVEEDDRDLTPLADAVPIAAPYRAEAVHRGGSTWAVAARSIEVAELPEEVEGEELVLSVSGDERALLVDGRPGFGSIPQLERLGQARYDSYVVRAERLDGRLWEIKVAPL